MGKNLSMDVEMRLVRIGQDAKQLLSANKEVRELTKSHLNFLGAEHSSLEELKQEISKIKGTDKARVNFRKLKSLLKWITRGERRDYRRENEIIKRVERLLSYPHQNFKYSELNDHLENRKIHRRIYEMLQKFLVFHGQLTEELSLRGELWEDIYKFMYTLEKIENISAEKEEEIILKHQKTLEELDKVIERLISEAEKIIVGMQGLLKEMEAALKTMVDSIYQESDPEFIEETGLFGKERIKQALQYYPILSSLMEAGKLNEAIKDGDLNPVKAVQISYLIFYREKKWKEFDKLFEEANTLCKAGKVYNPFPSLLFKVLDSGRKLSSQRTKEMIFNHPSKVYRLYILLPAIIHYGWKFGWKVVGSKVKIFMRASGRKIPTLGNHTIRYAEPQEEGVYYVDNSLIAFAHPFKDSVEEDESYGYSEMGDAHHKFICLGFSLKKPSITKMLESCEYGEGSILIPHSLFKVPGQINNDWKELTGAYKILVKQAR